LNTLISSFDINNGIFSKLNECCFIITVMLNCVFFYLDIQLYNFMNLYSLTLFSFPVDLTKDALLDIKIWNFVMEYCWKEYLDRLKKNSQLPKNLQAESLPILSLLTEKYILGILDGCIWKIKFEEKKSKINLLYEISNELSNENDINRDSNSDESDNEDEIIIKDFETIDINKIIRKKESLDSERDDIKKFNKEMDEDIYLFPKKFNKEMDEDIYLFPYMDIIHEFFKEALLDHQMELEQKLNQNSLKWVIKLGNKLKLLVFKKFNKRNKWKLICTRTDEFNVQKILLYKTFNASNNNFAFILTDKGFFIYSYNENNESINLNYFYYMDLKNHNIQYYWEKEFSKSTLPLPNHNIKLNNNEWILYIKDNKESLLKHGAELLSIAIKKHRLELIVDIYKKCMIHFKEDPGNNKMFLSIITSTISLLNEYYPEYVLDYSLKTTMITDSSFYTIKQQNNNLHLYSFQYPQIINLTQSILWTKYIILYSKLYEYNSYLYEILIFIQYLIIPFTLPILSILFPIFYILLKYHFIHDCIYRPVNRYFYIRSKLFDMQDVFTALYFFIIDKFDKFISIILPTPPTLTIAFMIPYIKFINYPTDYNWFLELVMPKSSPFAKTISRNIYKTWNGEALVNFKWNTFGKYYYGVIWGLFMGLLGCFTAAATIPQQYIDKNIQEQLLITSIILGFIHLSFEIRQIIYSPIKWIRDFWNLFGIYEMFNC
jgi:hypothetical protein